MTDLRIEGLGSEITQLRNRVVKLEIIVNTLTPNDPISVDLYDQTHAWSAAPNPEDGEIGKYGEWGQAGEPIWALNPGSYLLVNTFTIQAVDYGEVRWLQIRTVANDPSMTPDGFAWLPVDPKILNAEKLYDQLREGAVSEIKTDDYTQSYWDKMK